MGYYDDPDFYRGVFKKLVSVLAQDGTITAEEKAEYVLMQKEDGGPGVPFSMLMCELANTGTVMSDEAYRLAKIIGLCDGNAEDYEFAYYEEMLASK